MLERLKSLILTLLLGLLALQLVISMSMGVQGRIALPGSITDWFAAVIPPAATPQETTPRTAAWPHQMAVIHQTGVWVPWTIEEYETLYQQASGIYAEALGSSQEEHEMTRQQYLELLKQPGLLLSFEGNLPLSLHKAWTDSAPGSQEMAVQSILLTVEGETVELTVSDGTRYLRHSTVALGSDLLALTTGYPVNAFFAGQRKTFAHLAPDQLVYLEGGTLPGYALHQAAEDGTVAGEEILTALGFNPNLARSYISANGDVIYVDGDQVLALRRGGKLEYSYSPQEGESLQETGVEDGIAYCERVRSAVTTLWQQSGGSGRLSLSLYQYDGEKDLWVFGFDLLAGGRPVILDGSAAYATVQGGVITALSVTPVHMTATDSHYLSGYYLAAIAGGTDTRLLLCYQSDGQGGMNPALCVIDE